MQTSGGVINDLQTYAHGSVAGKRVPESADNRLYINCFKITGFISTVSRAAKARFIRVEYMLTKPRAGFTVSSKLASNCLKVRAHGLLSG